MLRIRIIGLAAATVGLALVGCKGEDGAMAVGAVDGGASRGVPDASTARWVRVVPLLDHLSSGHAPTASFRLAVYRSARMGEKDVLAAVDKAVSLRTYPGGASVALVRPTVEDRIAARLMVAAKAAAPLAVGSEYELRVNAGGVVATTRSHTLFHVGPLLRVQRVIFFRDRVDRSRIRQMTIKFSEPVDAARLAKGLRVLDGVKKVAIPHTMTGGGPGAERVGRVRFVTALDATARVAIEVPGDVGPGGTSKLDGAYDGKGRGTRFKVTVQLKDLKRRGNELVWEPSFKF